MPSTYSTSLRLELIGNGEQAGNWGNTNNINLGTLLEQAIAGVENVAISGTSYTLTTGNGVSDQARNAVIVLTGTLSANCNVIVPSVDKTYTFRNATTGGFSVVVKTAAGSGVTIANGFTQTVYCDATNVVASGPAFNNSTNSIAGNLVGSVSANAGSAAAPSITFTGDPDTGIYNAGPNQFAIATGGAVRFLVDASSYVGVNTIAPARQLEVASPNNHMRFSTPGDATAYYDFGRDNADGLFFFNGAQPTFVGYKWQINGTERLRLSATGQLLASSGTAAAPAYSFTGDPDTGIYNPGANRLAVSLGGVLTLDIKQTDAILYGDAAQVFSGLYMQNLGASASNQRVMDFSALNESGIPGTSIFQRLATDGSAVLELYATPSGARNTDRRVNRMTIPGSGAINMVGPVNVTSGALQVGGNPVQIQRGTEQATTSGTAIDFTSIPAGVRRITVMFDGVSFNGSDSASIQLGDSGGIEATGYIGQIGISAGTGAGSINATTVAAQIIYNNTAAADNCSGVIQIVNQSGNRWLITGQTARNGTTQIFTTIATKTLSDVLDRIRFKVDGASSFDAGAINIMWEF